MIRFQPIADDIIWTGNRDCEKGVFGDCHAEAFYSRDNGRNWKSIDTYVVNCAWAADAKLNADPTEILCESYQNKEGNQQFFQGNPLQLIEGQGYYSRKKTLFNQVVGFAKFSEFLVVAEVSSDSFCDGPIDDAHGYVSNPACIVRSCVGTPSLARWYPLCYWHVPAHYASRYTRMLDPQIFVVCPLTLF